MKACSREGRLSVSWLIVDNGLVAPQLGRGGEVFAEGGDHDALAVATGPLGEEGLVFAIFPPAGENDLCAIFVVEGGADPFGSNLISLGDRDDLSGLD